MSLEPSASRPRTSATRSGSRRGAAPDRTGALQNDAGDVVVAAYAGQPQLLAQLVSTMRAFAQVLVEEAPVGHGHKRQVAEHGVGPRVRADDSKERLKGEECAQSHDARKRCWRVPDD